MQMRIGGHDCSSADDRWIPVINPATGAEIDHVPGGTACEVDDAVRAAEDAFEEWSGKTVRERGAIFVRAARSIRERHHELARQLTCEQGKPIRESTDEVRGFANILEYYAGIAAAVRGDLLNLGQSGDCLVTREPLGVCGAIIPWNMPVLIMGWKISPALLAGNTFVFKPASETPLTALRIARLMEESGLPPGVLNVVTGRGDPVGEAIARHPAIKKVSFTGDSLTGDRIRELAAPSLKEVVLELGGSDPMIVWSDADIEKAVSGAVRGRFYNAGQTCTAVKRLYVHEHIASAFIEKLAARAGSLKIGDGLDSSVDMGPLAGKKQKKRITDLVDTIDRKGEGTIITGGFSPEGPEFEKGFYFSPTIVTEPHPDSAVLTQEVFGPVLPVIRVPDLDAAIRHANSTRFGLGASVWTHDTRVVKEVFTRVNAGIVWVNRHLTVPPEVPFGGVKASGIGRENGIQAYNSYTRTKSLFLGW
jgi:succinate-semialdehyde dehydrogenase/glutarate-semialdehyde dehydrogenase